ncbi:hypothetical protein MMC17_002262 [Xylographa soralifera]|nr:hypothetical protein [Xylographa soralifera]
MEHLMSEVELERVEHKIPPIPWLGFDHDTCTYDIASFTNYPLIRGWTPDQLDDLKSGKAPSRDYVSCQVMLQSWFFFGFLEGVFQQKLLTRDYVFNTPAGPLLKTTKLRNVIRLYVKSFNKAKEEERKVQGQRLHSCYNMLHRWYMALILHNTRRVSPELFDSPQFHSTMRMVLLSLATFGPLATVLTDRKIFELRYDTEANYTAQIDRFRAGGWCPFIIRKILLRSFVYAEYASLLEATDPNHSKHWRCTSTACNTTRLNVANSKARHLTKGCQCDLLKAPLNQVRTILKSGGIPLINLDVILGFPSTESSSVVEWTEGIKYLAFSHVWSDGLCSDTERGLPRCQIQKLYEHCRTVDQGALIWIDAFSIPHESITRYKAIQTMSTVYSRAAAVIILDTGLQSWNSVASAPLEALVRMLTSNWSQRLWTVPECWLASNALVVVHNGLVKPSGICDALQNDSMYIPYRNIAWTLSRLCQKTEALTLMDTHSLLGPRECSRPEDETLAIAPLLGLNITHLTEFEGQDRVAKFWQLVGRVPQYFLFLDSPRLEVPGFSWAPRTLMCSRFGGVTATMATVTPQGLQGTFFIFTLKKNKLVVTGRSPDIKPSVQQFSENADFVKIATSTGPISYDAILFLYAPSRGPGFQHGISLVADRIGDSPIRHYRYGCLVWLNTESWLIGPPTSDAGQVQMFPYTAQEMEMVIS